MKIDKALFDSVTAEAKQSPRLRMARDLRTTAGDHSQRMLNAIEPGTELPIHRHLKAPRLVLSCAVPLKKSFMTTAET